MPGTVLERPKLTKAMYQALKKHIMKEREKKKQGDESSFQLLSFSTGNYNMDRVYSH